MTGRGTGAGGTHREATDRRRFLLGAAGASAGLVSGCLRLTGGQGTDSPRGAEFTFDHRPADERVAITYAGGGSVQAGNVQVQSTAGTEANWPELGSTAAAPDEPLREGSTAVVGRGILNWERAVDPSETLRVVHRADGAPTTLARFSPGGGATATATASSDAAGAASGFRDGFDRERVGDDYVVTVGPAADWAIEPHLDGPSLHADKTAGGNGRILLDPERFSWSGGRRVAVDFRVNDEFWKMNGQVVFTAGDEVWVAHVGVQGEAVKLNHSGSDGPVAEANVPVSDGDVHTLEVRIENPGIRVSLDGEQRIDYAHSSELGPGTAGLGVNGADIEHETWFDDFRVESL